MSDGPRPEIRVDQLTGLRTILAAARADRPLDFSSEPPPATDPSNCPFCGGREERTPEELWRDPPDSAGSDWKVRAVPNLYPALARTDAGEAADEAASGPPADPLRASARTAEPDLFTAAPAPGLHEVIVHTPEHLTSLSQLDDSAFAAAIGGWRARIAAHSEEWPCVQLIVNEGPGAGASRDHTHAQLYALPFVPVAIARERERFNAYNERTMGGELLADVGSEEVRRRDRLVAIDDDAMVICPWASRGPFELRVIPRRSAPRFEADGEVGTGTLRTALDALRRRFGDGLEMNIWVRTAPRGADVFHWHIDIAPRIAIKAGFELSTSVDINTYPPERAAAELREAIDS